MTPHSRGSVDYPSTRGIQVDVGLPDATSENRAESPLYGELYPNKTANIITMIQIWIKTASWAHTTISIKTYQLYPIVLRVQMFYSYTTYIKILEF